MTEPRRALVVDDDAGMRAGLAAVLERGGFAVETGQAGEEALARLERGGIDLLVTDLRMPGLGGLDLLREARRVGVDTPAIVSKIQPLPRLGLTSDVANAAVYLASDRSAHVTGAVLPVDGGTTVGPPPASIGDVMAHQPDANA